MAIRFKVKRGNDLMEIEADTISEAEGLARSLGVAMKPTTQNTLETIRPIQARPKPSAERPHHGDAARAVSMDDMVAFVKRRPNYEHTVQDLVKHFFPGGLPSRFGKEQNPAYNGFIHKIIDMRKGMEKERGRSFEIIERGREKVYRMQQGGGS